MSRKTANKKASGAAGVGSLAQARASVPLEREPRTLREEQQRATRYKLIQAAFKCFTHKGFHDTTIAEIVKAAGTSRATFYLHFAGKSEALAASWAELEQSRMIEQWHKLDAMDPWTEAGIHGWMADMIDVWEDARNFAIASNQAVSSNIEMSQQWFRGISEYMEYVPNVLRRLAQDSDNPAYRFMMLCTQMDRSVFMYLTESFPGTRDEFVATLGEFWRDALVERS
ncbi:TetR/AcrR family transcriptional regulator [Salipiger abyssi]|uniref:TetR/AcrR family transcriptional regulator n=1 Tax=Salipiger abyssi TaxID=1250539 RepID=UPI0009FB0C6B|nr:TetR/AcrR family transcriptional regulator [Salipiger abyssi]